MTARFFSRTLEGVAKYFPSGPVLSQPERESFSQARASGARYTGPPKVAFPVLPLQVWAIHYELDLVLESTHPDYDMHEYARVRTPAGPVWLAKDAVASTKLQSIIADLPALHSWLPELPITRKVRPVTVDDRSSAAKLDLQIAYQNLAGEQVVVRYEGKPPRTAQRKRNTNTMGHSASLVMVVVDVAKQDFARRVSIEIGGRSYPIRRVWGLVPIRAAQVQTQAGLSISRFCQRPAPGGFCASYDLGQAEVPTAWTLESAGGVTWARQGAELRELGYRFAERDGALELEQLQVEQFGVEGPLVTICLQPALPDMRRPFEGRVACELCVDLNDQRGLARGRLEAWWEGDEAKVALIPEAPSWVADRPMQTTIRYADAGAQVAIERVP